MTDNSKEKRVKYETIVFIIAVMVGLMSVAFSTTYYYIKKDEAIKSSVESAIVKGIDPIAVKCAYGGDSWVCMQYAQSHAKPSSDTPKK